MDMAAFGTAKNASKWHGVFPASLCRRLGGFSFGAMAAVRAEVEGRAAVTGGKAARAGCNGAAGLSRPFAAVQRGGGRQGAAAAETASKLRRNGVVYFMSYLHRIFYVLSLFVVM